MASLVFVLATIISYRFEDIETEDEEEITIRDSIKSVQKGLKHIIRSKRLKSLFLFMAIFGGTVIMVGTYERSLLVDLQVAPQYFGIIFAVLTIISAFSAKCQDKLHNKFKNKTLAAVSIPVFISFVLIGAITILDVNYTITMIVVLICFSIHHFFRAPYWTLNKRYSINFTNSDIRTSVLSAGELIEGIGTSIIFLLAGLLLEYYDTNMAYLIIGIAGTIVMLLALRYMKPRLGLNPREYNKEEIEHAER